MSALKELPNLRKYYITALFSVSELCPYYRNIRNRRRLLYRRHVWAAFPLLYVSVPNMHKTYPKSEGSRPVGYTKINWYIYVFNDTPEICKYSAKKRKCSANCLT